MCVALVLCFYCVFTLSGPLYYLTNKRTLYKLKMMFLFHSRQDWTWRIIIIIIIIQSFL